jgi:hypothetical protein
LAFNIQYDNFSGCGNSTDHQMNFSLRRILEQLQHSKGGEITAIIFSQHFLLSQNALKFTCSNVEVQNFFWVETPNPAKM